MSRNHILIVEDEPFVQGLISAYLQQEGFETTRVGCAREFAAEIDRRSFSAILLDLGLPDEDGLVLMRQLRRRTRVPVMVLSARTAAEDRIGALELGADDFVTKPVEPRELLLRLRRLIGLQQDAEAERIAMAGWVLDTAARVLVGPAGKEIILRRAEFNLLTAFFVQPNRVLSRGQLLDAIAVSDHAPTDRAIDVLVSRLRRKLGPEGGALLVTVPGIGYKLEAPVG